MLPRLPQKMQNTYSKSDIPSFARKGYAFDTLDLDLYQELSQISEEIEQCRNSQLN